MRPPQIGSRVKLIAHPCKLRNGPCGLSSLVLVVFVECKGTVHKLCCHWLSLHTLCCHWLAANAAFTAKQRRNQEFCSGGANHLTYVRLFLAFICEQLILI